MRAKFNNGEDCNIEVQVKPYVFMPERLLDYWGGMYENKINSGQDYEVLKPTFSILIAGYNVPKLKYVTKYHTKWNLREEDYPELIITDNIEMHILELPKINEKIIQNDELALWLQFIKSPGNKEVWKIMEENKYLKQARKELEYLSGDPNFQRELEARAGFLRDMDWYRLQREREAEKKGIAEGKKEGRLEGKLEEKMEMAKKLKTRNMPLGEIAEITGLTEDEINKIVIE